MNPRGRAPILYEIEGRKMTVKEIAEMMGISKHALEAQRYRRQLSYQAIVAQYRQNRVLKMHDRWPRHLVHGQWMTVQQAAASLGLSPHTLRNWMAQQRGTGQEATLEAAWDHYKYDRGRRGGRTAIRHWVNNRQLTVAEAAEKYRLSENALRLYMFKHRASLNTAVKRCQEARQKRAEREIMTILGF